MSFNALYGRLDIQRTLLFLMLLHAFWSASCSSPEIASAKRTLHPLPNFHNSNFEKTLSKSIANNHPKSGFYSLDRGRDSLVARAYLTEQATTSIDIQYFIWSVDNIGILASESLLRAAERGVKIRILVDDFLMDADSESLLALSLHPNIQIKIYNPKYKVGTDTIKKYKNLFTKFVESNQRMHNKTFIVDNQIAITGGRNIADEYFDFDHTYNFRDRDVMLLGPVAQDITKSFELFWSSHFSMDTEKLLEKNIRELSANKVQTIYKNLGEYAQDIENYDDEHRELMVNLPQQFDLILQEILWDKIEFISDLPGKNEKGSMDGGGITTQILMDLVSNAKKSVVIQSPYFVVTDVGIDLFKKLTEKNVDVVVVTNSLASTDNLFAYSGFNKKKRILKSLGIKIYEYKPHPEIFNQLFAHEKFKNKKPIFGLHAKTLVVDSETAYIGTFNLDPRSANLNTECGVVVKNKVIAGNIEKQIRDDSLPGNSWSFDDPAMLNGISRWKRIKLWFFEQLPLDSVL